MNWKPPTLRLQSLLAKAGLCSRRGAVTIIQTGQVKVNGRVVLEPGLRVGPQDEVLLNNRPVPFAVPKRYLMINKPRGYLCSRKDSFGRALVLDLIPKKYRKGLYPVGRLDYDSEGLLLLTNDGDWAQLFLRPRYGVPKEYRVLLDRPLPLEQLKRFEQGIRIEGEILRARSVKLLEPRLVEVVLVEGKNREIRRVMEKLGARVLRLVRQRIGHLGLEGLDVGCWKKIERGDVERFWADYGRHA